ncbi:MAG: transglutaminase domain-containing protein [Planctomycetia bacterium]|nr:transglutaminase domain-containing protein [Planctomycetia bacterium]
MYTTCHDSSKSSSPAAHASAAELEDFEESWQVVYIGKSRVGYARSSSGRLKRDGREVVMTDSEMNMTIARFKQSVKTKAITHSEETPEGELLAFRFEMQNPPAAPLRSSGRVEGDKLFLTTETNGKPTTKEMKWDRSVKSPAYQDRLLRENPLKPGDKRVLETFDPQFGKRSTVTLTAGAIEDVPLLGGKSRKLLAVAISQSVAPLITATEFLDEKGVALKSIVSFANMATYTVTKDEALKALTGEEVDMAFATLVKAGKIDRSAETRRAVYRVSITGEDPAKALSTGPTQQVERVSDYAVDLTVTAIAPPEEAPAGAPQNPGREFLAPNEYIQSDDNRVRKHAADAVKDESEPWKQSQLMEKWVAENLKQKNFSTLLASAAEVAKDLSGDCTEHAVLLAAMCRARGIPSRVAVGLVYVPSLASFGGHMWTEVYVRGKWVPLDATLGRGGIAADHIKFGDSSFSSDGDVSPIMSFLPLVAALSKMKIEVRDVKYE